MTSLRCPNECGFPFEKEQLVCRVDNDALEAAHRLLQPICLRRLKEDVEKTLPARVTSPSNFSITCVRLLSTTSMCSRHGPA